MTTERRTQILGADRERARARARELYRQGASVAAVGDAIGREFRDGAPLSYGAAHNLLTSSGVEFRSRGGSTYRRGGRQKRAEQ